MENNNIIPISPLQKRQRERFVHKASQVSAKYLRRLTELPGTPETLTPFVDTLSSIFVDMKDAARPRGVKTVGTYCVMVPQELVYAAGAMPVKLCSGSYTAFNIGDDITPRDACPLVKAVLGFETIGAMPLYQNCGLMVVPITCDCKKKMAGMLAEHFPVINLHVPSSKAEDEDMEQYVKELYELADALSGYTGTAITYDRLSDAAALIAAAQYELSRFVALKKAHPLLIRGSHAMAAMNALSYTHIANWTRQMSALNRELMQRARKKQYAGRANQPRILVTGSPIVFPNMKVPLLIEETGGALVGDETCMGERGMYDPLVVVDRSFDGIMRAMANRYTRPCTCPTFVDNRQRVFRIRQMIADHQVEGVIYHVLRGCLVYDYEYAILEEEMGKKGIPIIRLETDYNEEDVEQLRIRIEAFIELIKLGNEKRKIRK